MKIIKVSTVVVNISDGEGGTFPISVNVPEEPLPLDSVKNVYDAALGGYIVYQDGDVFT
jgi:hypothetical protein